MTNWIFESLTLPRDDAVPQACEDRVLVLPPDFAAVIDGATDVGGQLYGGQTGGALAAEAIAAAFTEAWFAQRQGGPDPFATAKDALALADRAIAALYTQLGLSTSVHDLVLDPGRRFRAAFAVVSRRDGDWRGVGVGDCALRIDDAQPMLRDHPAELVFAAWRAAMIAADPARPEVSIRAALVRGWAQADAAARKAADDIPFADRAFARCVLSAGLAGMRAARPSDALAFGVADGVGDMGHDFCWQVRSPDTEAQSLALWTDGWLSPGGQAIESWLTAADATHADDPKRIGRHRCVKGPGACGRHDDMGLVLIRRVPA